MFLIFVKVAHPFYLRCCLFLNIYEFSFLICRELSEDLANCHSNKKKYNILVSLSGHLFDQFLINEALDIIEAAGGSFHLVKCQVGQSANVMSYSELKVSRSLFQLIFGRANLCLDIREV
jgi:hypothetical protein